MTIPKRRLDAPASALTLSRSEFRISAATSTQTQPRSIASSRGRLHDDTLAVVMAGGNGTRLKALTRQRCKPALPFAGQSRNIDFPLSNCINSGIRRIGVLTQYMGHSLMQHVSYAWRHLRPEFGEFVESWPAQQRAGPNWYRGTADAIYQNLDLIRMHAPRRVLVLAGDHVYRMDYSDMLATHQSRRADVTIGTVEVPVDEARSFGVLETDGEGWITRFVEKPQSPAPMSGSKDRVLGSMGIYVFDTDFLIECLEADAREPGSGHDFGRDVLPALIGGRCPTLSYRFRDAKGAPGYWRDVGTVDSYWQAHMELLGQTPALELDDPDWPIWTYQPPAPAPRFVGNGVAKDSIVSVGSVVAGQVSRSVLSPGCYIGAGSTVEDAVILPNARIGRDCRIRRAIVDEDAEVPDRTVIEADLAYWDPANVSSGGVAVYTMSAAAVDDERSQAAGGFRVA